MWYPIQQINEQEVPMTCFTGSFKNRYHAAKSQTEKSVARRLQGKKLNEIPLGWYGDDTKIPHFPIETVKDPELVYGLYVETAGDLKKIGQFPNLISLIYRNDRITTYPKGMSRAKQLRYLQLRCPNVTDAPEFLKNFKYLKKVELVDFDQPESIANLSNCTRIQSIVIRSRKPRGPLAGFEALRFLPLIELDVRALPMVGTAEPFGLFRYLKELQVTLRSGADAALLSGLTQLDRAAIKIVNCDETDPISDLNTFFAEQTELVSLNLKSDIDLSDYSGLSNLKNLKTLRLDIPEDGTSFQEFPESIGTLENLEELQITAFKAGDESNWLPLVHLQKLKRLSLGLGSITSVPEQFSALSLLEELDFDRFSALRKIDALSSCSKLKVLLLNDCGDSNDQLTDTLITMPQISHLMGHFESENEIKLTEALKPVTLKKP